MKFTKKEDAVKYCIDNLKPSVVGLEAYNRLRQVRKRYQDDPDSIKENAIKSLFEAFGVKEKCSYEIPPFNTVKDEE